MTARLNGLDHEPAKPDDVRLDFACIGVPKSRTTWLAHVLDDHPEIRIASVKENNFFVHEQGVFTEDPNPNYLKDWDWYRSLFDGAPTDAVLGDFSIEVWRNPDVAPAVLRSLFPDLKLIASLRDPVRRLYSHYWYVYARVRHWGGVPDTFEEAIARDDFVDRSRYAKRLHAWLEHFPRDQLAILIDLDLNDDPLGEIQRVYRFLGVDDTFEPPTLRQRINPPRGRRGVYGALYKVAQGLRKAGLGVLVDATKKLRIERAIDRVDMRDFEYPPIDPDVDAELRERLRPDIERLEAFLDRDLTPWKEGTTPSSGRLDAPRGDSRMKLFQVDEPSRD